MANILRDHTSSLKPQSMSSYCMATVPEGSSYAKCIYIYFFVTISERQHISKPHTHIAHPFHDTAQPTPHQEHLRRRWLGEVKFVRRLTHSIWYETHMKPSNYQLVARPRRHHATHRTHVYHHQTHTFGIKLHFHKYTTRPTTTTTPMSLIPRLIFIMFDLSPVQRGAEATETINILLY